MILIASLAALLLAAGPEDGPGAATPAPTAAPAPAPSPSPAAVPAADAAAPLETFPPVSFRASVGLGATSEMGKDDGNLTPVAAALLFRAGPLVLGPEVGVHWFPGAPGADGGARGVSGSLLVGSGFLLAPRLRLTAFADVGFQTYWLYQEGFSGSVSGGDGQATFAGARLGLDWLLRGHSGVGVHAAFRQTLGSSTERYTKTFGGLPMESGEIRYGGFTLGLEVVVWVALAAGSAGSP